jgi:hypothetical protein
MAGRIGRPRRCHFLPGFFFGLTAKRPSTALLKESGRRSGGERGGFLSLISVIVVAILAERCIRNDRKNPLAIVAPNACCRKGDGYLVGTVEEAVFKAKSNELKAEAARADETLAQLGDTASARGEMALALFDWTQRAADIWRGSNPAVRRQILDCVCLNRTLGDVSLCLAKKKPFDVFAEGLDLKNSRGERI